MGMPNRSKIIIHRSQLHQNTPENTLLGMNECLHSGFSAEIDVYLIDGRYFIGHDLDNLATVKFEEIDKANVFIHMKSLNFTHTKNADLFYMEDDPVTLTLKGRQWVNAHVSHQNKNTVICSNELIGGQFDHEKNIQALKNDAWVCTKFGVELYRLWSDDEVSQTL